MSAVARSQSLKGHEVRDPMLHMLKFISGDQSARLSRLSKLWLSLTSNNNLWEIYLKQDFNHTTLTRNPKLTYQDRYCETLPPLRIKEISCRLEKGLSKNRTNSFGNLKVVYVVVG